jgi:hypothetical protein
MSRELSMNYDDSIKQYVMYLNNDIVAYGGDMEECLENYRIIACAPAICKCPELSFYEDIDGNTNVIIKDDYNGVVIMTPEQFSIMAAKFLEDKNNGNI